MISTAIIPLSDLVVASNVALTLRVKYGRARRPVLTQVPRDRLPTRNDSEYLT